MSHVSTKQVVMEATKELMALTPDSTGSPSAIGLNQFADEVNRLLLAKFGNAVPSIQGAVASSYALARLMAPAVVATVQTKEDLGVQIQLIGEVVLTTMRLSLETAWNHAHNGTKANQPLIITVPGGVQG